MLGGVTIQTRGATKPNQENCQARNIRELVKKIDQRFVSSKNS